MPKSHKAYPRELKARLIEMVRAGRTPEELAEKFEPTARRPPRRYLDASALR